MGLTKDYNHSKNLERFQGELPFIFTYHGLEDSRVPVEGTEKQEHLFKGKNTQVRVTYEDGGHELDQSSSFDTP